MEYLLARLLAVEPGIAIRPVMAEQLGLGFPYEVFDWPTEKFPYRWIDERRSPVPVQAADTLTCRVQDHFMPALERLKFLGARLDVQLKHALCSLQPPPPLGQCFLGSAAFVQLLLQIGVGRG